MDRLRIARIGPGRARTRPGRLLADKAYSSKRIRTRLRQRGIKATIPEPADQIAHRSKRGSNGGRRPAFDPLAYKDRNTVERAFNKLRAFRAVAMRTDKRDYIYQGTIDVAAIKLWLRDPVHHDPSDTP
jgi:transposase